MLDGFDHIDAQIEKWEDQSARTSLPGTTRHDNIEAVTTRKEPKSTAETHTQKGLSKMARYDIPETKFISHPEGQHKGVIYDVEDLGIVQTTYGDKYKVAVKIESQTAKMDDGNPFIIQVRYNLSSSPKSNFVKLRQLMMGRQLSPVELTGFDDSELINRHIGFIVMHNTTDTGTYANVDQIWPLDAEAQTVQQPTNQATQQPAMQPQQGPVQDQQAAQAGAVTPGSAQDDDLPF